MGMKGHTTEQIVSILRQVEVEQVVGSRWAGFGWRCLVLDRA